MHDLLSNWNSLLMGDTRQVFAGGANLRMLQLQVHLSIWRQQRVPSAYLVQDFPIWAAASGSPRPQARASRAKEAHGERSEIRNTGHRNYSSRAHLQIRPIRARHFFTGLKYDTSLVTITY